MQHPHKFKVGRTVRFTPGPMHAGGRGGTYKITRLLPPSGDDNQYRIQSIDDGHERVVKEDELT